MEELKRLAAEYYKNTVRLRYFGLKGFLCIVATVILLALYLWFTFKEYEVLGIISLFLGIVIGQNAKKEYNKKLICHLSCCSLLDSNDVSEHKAIYLSILTSHISLSLFDTMRIFREMIEVDDQNRRFSPENKWHLILKFIYNPEAKERIISLLIYLMSLVAVMIVVEPNSSYNVYRVYELLHENGMWLIGMLFSFLGIAILFGYFMFLALLTFVWSFMLVPILLHCSFDAVLIDFFISELNRYAYIEQRFLSPKQRS